MKIYFLLFLSLVSVVSANTIVTENDPSSLVNNVSMITGDFYTFDEDFVVQGREPIKLRRAYLSSKGDWNLHPHLFAQFMVQSGIFQIAESNGTVIYYSCPHLVKKKDKKKKHGATRCNPRVISEPGVTNTASGRISAHTNYENQYILVDEDAKGIVVFAANGTKRRYKALRHQKKIDLGFGTKGFLQYFYALQSEELPNGNTIEYSWNDQNQLEWIQTLSPRRKRYAYVFFPTGDKPIHQYTMNGSDGRSLCYESSYLDPKHQKYWALQSANSPDSPKRNFSYAMKDCKLGEKFKIPYLEKISLPDGRETIVEYEELRENYSVVRHRVKRLRSPVGPDQTPQVSHTFFYFPEDRNSYVIDAEGNKTAYFWNGDFRLTRIDFYEGQEILHHSERFVWEGIRIRCKSHFDSKNTPIWARTFDYDQRGNLTRETFFGNISGEGSSLHIGENGFPMEDGVEKCVKKTEYTNDGRNLPIRQEEASGLVILYEYFPNTHLLKSKFLCI